MLPPCVASHTHTLQVTSSAKKKCEPGSTHIHQTPEGAFYDLQRNAWQVLQRCGMRHVPAVGDVAEYLATGPGKR